MSNHIFCAGTTTDVYHNRSTIEGRPNGTYYAEWHWKKTGICQGLLSSFQWYGYA